MENKELLSIVIPVYGEKKLVKMLYDKLLESLSTLNMNFEIIMVNDACPYGSGEEIEKLALKDKRVKFIDLSRNFGQHYAIKAGVDNSQGDWVVIMDCDLQDNPEDIPRFYEKAKEGYDIVFGERKERIDSTFKKFLSKAYSIVANKLTQFHYTQTIGNFSMISKKVAQEIMKINNYNFAYYSIVNWLGFKVGYVDIKKEERAAGKSNYSLYKGLKLAADSIISSSNRPLVFAAYCAFVLFLLCIFFIVKLFIDYYLLNKQLLGWTSIMVSIFFIGGLIFAYLGILGLYIGGIFQEVKHRSLYVIKKKIN